MCAADADKEAVLAYRQALEQALDQPAAAHPYEAYGETNMSLAQVSQCVLSKHFLQTPLGTFFMAFASVPATVYMVIADVALPGRKSLAALQSNAVIRDSSLNGVRCSVGEENTVRAAEAGERCAASARS